MCRKAGEKPPVALLNYRSVWQHPRLRRRRESVRIDRRWLVRSQGARQDEQAVQGVWDRWGAWGFGVAGVAGS